MTAVLLGYRDLESARQRFTEALGFEEVWSARSDDGELTRVHVRLGGALLMLGAPGDHGIMGPLAAGGQTHLVIVQVDDVDAHHARARSRGVEIVTAPTVRPWGREYEVVDPEGYGFAFFAT